MTQSFDEWLFNHNHESVPEFSESAFKAGQQSRQAEIDELKSTITKQQIQILQVQQHCGGCDSRDLLIDELQKRIDDLKNINESLVAYKNQLLDELKGEEDE